MSMNVLVDGSTTQSIAAPLTEDAGNHESESFSG